MADETSCQRGKLQLHEWIHIAENKMVQTHADIRWGGQFFQQDFAGIKYRRWDLTHEGSESMNRDGSNLHLCLQCHKSLTGGSFLLRIMSAAFSPIITEVAIVFPVTISGIILASATRSPSIPCTLQNVTKPCAQKTFLLWADQQSFT